MEDILDKIEQEIKQFGSWHVAGWSGEHDETGANIRDSKTKEFIAQTASVFTSNHDWQAYTAKAHFIANAPDYIRYLLSVIKQREAK